MPSRVTALFILGALVASCSTAQIERRTLPLALAEHVASLPSFDAASHVVVPEGLAWNASVDAIRAYVPIAEADPATYSLLTHYHYDEALAAGLRTQTRTFFEVQFTPDPRRGLVPHVQARAESRTRGVCGVESTYAPQQADATALVERVQSAVAGLAHAPLTDFVFEAEPAALAAALVQADQSYVLTTSVGADGAPVVEATGRASAAQRRDVLIEVQSGYRATLLPKGGGTRVVVEAWLSHRTSDDESDGAFVQDDPTRVVEGVYGMLAQLAPVRDLVLADAPFQIALDGAPTEPPLLPATDDLQGRFEAYVQFMGDPRRRSDQAFWSRVSNVYVVVEAAGQRSASDAISPFSANEMLMRGLPLDLAGDTTITISLASAPVAPDATIPVAQLLVATTSASGLLLACRPTCFEADGGTVCLGLSRP